ncbi:MAG TPA: glycoside hydrolase family 15 protein [Myxococcales bacterium]|jgi:GH15 family glucan-1,4-alpha-glucosidase
MTRGAQRYPPIEDYALIGDCHGSALVSKSCAIDWACLRRFDDGAVFCRLLDADKGGTFALTARGLEETKRRYLPDTNVLETTVVTSTGIARVIDCFAMRRTRTSARPGQILRLVEGVRGKVAFEVLISPRFDYAGVHPWLRHHAREKAYSAVGGDDAIVLTAQCALEIDQDQASLRGEVMVRAGEKSRLTVSSALPHDLDPRPVTARAFDSALRDSIAFWKRWVAKGKQGNQTPEVKRSALVLKLLTCAPTGAIIAAPTTSLPERIGGSRNWDYRYSWVRDATMALGALFAAGHPAAATEFKQFIETATAGRADELQIMYGCYGERRLTEVTLDHLEGYRGSRPVRAGNGAATQLQLDVYGELLDAARLWTRTGTPVSDEGWVLLRGLVEEACTMWKKRDRGLWEVRGKPQHFVYSKVMCWLAVARGIELAEEQKLPCDLARWKDVRDRIRRSIEKNGVDQRRNCFVQAYGSKEMDASLLRLPLVGFVRADHPRMKATVAEIRKQLATGALVRRYRPSAAAEGLKGGEGTFLIAGFWLVDVLVMSGEIEEAEKHFRELLALANDVGLFAEEYDPRKRQQLGNFPQTFTHMALIVAAEQLRRARSGESTSESLGERLGRGRGHRATMHHGRAR